MSYLFENQDLDFHDVRAAIIGLFWLGHTVTIHDGDGCTIFGNIPGHYCSGTKQCPIRGHPRNIRYRLHGRRKQPTATTATRCGNPDPGCADTGVETFQMVRHMIAGSPKSEGDTNFLTLTGGEDVVA